MESTMHCTRPQSSAGGDRLSQLGDLALGHVLSFLPAKEAARTALLSSRWRDVFGAVHTVSLEEPEPPLQDYDDNYDVDSWDASLPDPNAPPPFHCAVSNALLARSRRRGAAPLRALRVDMEDGYKPFAWGAHSTTVDQWFSYAVQQAAPEGLRLDLRLRRAKLCHRPYSLRHQPGGQRPDADEEDRHSSSSRATSWGRSDDEAEDPYPKRRRSISSNEGSSDADYSGDRAVSPRQRWASGRKRSSSYDRSASPSPRERCTRRSLSPLSSSSTSWGRSRSISSNEGSSDADYAGDRALSPRQQRWASGSKRSSSYDRSPSPSPRERWTKRSRSSSYDRSPSPTPRERCTKRSRSPLSSSSDDTVFWPSPRGRGHDEEEAPRPKYGDRRRSPKRTVPTSVFSCAALRSLSLGHFLLAPPVKVNLPSLETLLLSHVDTDPGTSVEQIVAGSPRLADLTLEACKGLVSLYLPSCARLRRLALRCCHNLATVVVDASSELVAFEYRGGVPSSTFLTLHGGSPNVAYCKVDICGMEVSSEEEATRLWQFLQLFAQAKRLHLESARLGSGIHKHKDVSMNYSPALLPCLRHLELRGRLPDDDDGAMVVGSVSRILGHAPNLQVLSLVFHPEEHDRRAGCSYISGFNEEELLDKHRLKYNGHPVFDTPPPLPSSMIPCLRSSVREINLAHYQGGRAQRALAMFLLRNAPVIDTLWCEFAEGPLWMQTQLMREIKSWVINESAKTHFL